MLSSILILGIGNRDRGDDAVGPLAAEALASDCPSKNIRVQAHHGEGASLMALWQEADRVIIVDAMRSKTRPGTIRRFDAKTETLESGTFRYSSHLFSLAEAVETARRLGQLPESLVVYGIEGEDFTFGAPLTRAVEKALAKVVAAIQEELKSCLNNKPKLRQTKRRTKPRA